MDENKRPIAPGIVVNPDAPCNEQRYLLKNISNAQGAVLPSIGIMVDF